MKKYLLLAGLLLIAHPAFATFTRVQQVTGSGITGIAIPGVVVNHLLVYQVASFGNPVTSVNGDNGNTWVHATGAQTFHAGLSEYVDTFYVLNSTAGTTTASPVSGASFAYTVATEYAYTGSSVALDIANALPSSATATGSTVPIVPTHDHDLLIALVVTNPGPVSAAPASWTNFITSTTAYDDGAANFTDAGLAGSKTANFTFSAASDWLETVAAFTDTTGGGGMDSLAFSSPPTAIVSGSNFSPVVTVTASLSGGGTDTAFTGNVTLTMNACGAASTGTTTRAAVAGVATFSGLGATTVATGCVYTANATGTTSINSTTFNVTAASTTITFDARTTGADLTGAAATMTISHTLTGANLYLIVDVKFNNSGNAFTLSGCTYDGAAMEVIAADVYDASTGFATGMCGRAATAGAHTVVITISGATAILGVARSYTGVNASTSHGTAVTNVNSITPTTITISSAAGELVIDSIGEYGTTSNVPNSSQTARFNTADFSSGSNNFRNFSGADIPGTGSLTLSWTNAAGGGIGWTAIALALKPNATGGGSTAGHSLTLLGVGR